MVALPVNPECHLTPALSPTSWRRGRQNQQIGLNQGWFSRKWRYRLLSAALLLGTKSLLACGPWFPNNMLDRGDAAVLVAPLADFYGELERIPASPTPVRAVTSTNSYADETLQTELADLRAALQQAGKSSNDVERIVLSHSEQRMKLQEFIDFKPHESFDEPAEPLPAPPFPAVSIVEGLPGEFADYFEGAIAWHKPEGKDAARQAWEHLLNRPPEERHYKSTWAAFMLGRSWEEEDPKKARDYYKQVRALATQGFADPAGLAAASMGWEARLALRANEFETALDLYLQQYAAGSSGSAESLQFAVARAINAGPRAFVPLVVNPQARKLVTAYLISRHPYDETTTQTIRESTKAWLAAVEQANVKDVESAEQFALAAYRADDMEAAIRWVNRAGNSPTAQWLTAKLLLRAGKVAKATELLSRIVNSFPTEEPTNEPVSFGDGLFVLDANDYDRIPAGRYIRGELGALRLSRREYVQSLDLLLRGEFEEDAAYVADHVLTTEELKSYVDANWPAIVPSPDEGKSEEEKRFEKLTSDIRYLLARRLARESHIAEAMPYYPTEWLPMANQLMQALTVGWDESLVAEQRAKALAAAAFIARTNGMELLGTEAGPDWHIYSGDFEGSVTVEVRSTNEEASVLLASADELKRNAESKTDPDQRFHYRYQAAALAWEAAKLMPNNSDDTARLLCTAGGWLKFRDPLAADLFYKTLVRRCRKTAIGAEADRIRWFPDLDAEGNLELEYDGPTEPVVEPEVTSPPDEELPTPVDGAPPSEPILIQEAQIPSQYFIQKGDSPARIARQFGITIKSLVEANPGLNLRQFKIGQVLVIPGRSS